MTCQHQSPRDEVGFYCAAGRYGGKPHAIACQKCMSEGRHTLQRETPSALKMAKGLVSSIKDEVIARATQQPALDPQEIERRLTLCRGCEHFIKASSRCSKCGCFMAFKSRLRSAHCPIGKW